MGADGSRSFLSRIGYGEPLRWNPGFIQDHSLRNSVVELMDSWYAEGRVSSRRKKKILWAKADELYDILYPERED